MLIVGGGPAGSTCAWKLGQSGFDVVVIDRERFPRDKVCGGWITPQVVAELDLDLDEYRRGRILQPITGFRTGTIGGRHEIDTAFRREVSFGIRRCEFDDYILRRSGARVRCGKPVVDLSREGRQWIVNDTISAPMLVGAAGHFCPVARRLNGGERPWSASLVVAQEVEFAVDSRMEESFATPPDIPELYFSHDLRGYGWCFRKQNYINIGLGRVDQRALPAALAAFVAFLEKKGRIPRLPDWHWRGHAYLLSDVVHRRSTDDGVVLVGDAAGLAYPQSGEGIRPAVESALVAARTILEADGNYYLHRLRSYETALNDRFRARVSRRAVSPVVPMGVLAPLGRLMLQTPAFVRHVALGRWFLHADTQPFAA